MNFQVISQAPVKRLAMDIYRNESEDLESVWALPN